MILAVEAGCLTVACSIDKNFRVWQDRRIADNFAQTALLLLVGAVVGEFVANDSSGMRYERPYNILLESESKIEI